MSDNKWSAVFAGDVLLAQDRDSLVSDELRSLIRSCAIASCNIEAPMPSDGKPIPKAGPHLTEHPSAARLIHEAGFTVTNIGNNHAYDYGDAGMKRTLEAFSDLTVIGGGMSFGEAYQPKEVTVGSVRVGLISFCEAEFGALTEGSETRGGYAWINHPEVNDIVRRMKKEYDVVLVQAHAGLECIDIPLPEWRTRYRELIDCGADAVIASHPHIVQGYELHDGKSIIYSLGNFCFDKRGADTSWNTGIIALFEYEGATRTGMRLIPVESDGKTVSIGDEAAYQAHMETLNAKLANPAYGLEMNRQVTRLWKTTYSRYFLGSMNTLDTRRPFLANLKAIAKFLLGRARIDTLMLLHNIRIESHRYAIIRALSLSERA